MNNIKSFNEFKINESIFPSSNNSGREFTSGNIQFNLDNEENHDDVTIIYGTLTYNDEEYFGDFSYYTNGQSIWNFDNLELDSDDLYEMDSLMQQIEDILQINL